MKFQNMRGCSGHCSELSKQSFGMCSAQMGDDPVVPVYGVTAVHEPEDGRSKGTEY